jgi:hypothetical protein
LKVPVGGGFVYAEVIEVTKLTTDEPVNWKRLAAAGWRERFHESGRRRSQPRWYHSPNLRLSKIDVDVGATPKFPHLMRSSTQGDEKRGWIAFSII